MKLCFRVSAIFLAAVLVFGTLLPGFVYADDDLKNTESGNQEEAVVSQDTEPTEETLSSGDPVPEPTEGMLPTGNTEPDPSEETLPVEDSEPEPTEESLPAEDSEPEPPEESLPAEDSELAPTEESLPTGDSEPEPSGSQQEETTEDESADVPSIDMRALVAWAQEHPDQLSAVYSGDASAIASLAESLAVSEDRVSVCVSDLKDQNDILVQAIEDGTDVLSTISFQTSQEAAEELGVEAVAIDLFGVKLGYVSSLLSTAMAEAEENDQQETWYQALGKAMGSEELLAQTATEYNVEPAVLAALLRSMEIEAIADDDTSIILTNMELEVPDGVNDKFVYQIYLWSTNSSGTISPLTGYHEGATFTSLRLTYVQAYNMALPYNNSYYTTYGYAEVPLSAGESVSITGLPEGCNYLVLTSASANYYIKDVTSTYGTVDRDVGTVTVYGASGPNEIICVNDYAPHSLRISEEVISSDPDSINHGFTFKIYLYTSGSSENKPLFDEDSVDLEISTDYSEGAVAPTLGTTLKFTKQYVTADELPGSGLSVDGTYNVAEVTLKHGQSIVLKHLGNDYGCYIYQVPETHYMLYFLKSRHVYVPAMAKADFQGSYDGHYQYINSCSVSSSVAFTNAQVTLGITKQVEGSDTTRSFVFNVYFMHYSADTYRFSPMQNASFNLSYTNATGNEPTTIEVHTGSDRTGSFTDYNDNSEYSVTWSVGQVQVAAGQTVTIEGLPAAIAYYISEVPVANYTLTSATTTSTDGYVTDDYSVCNAVCLTDEAATFTNTYTPPVGNDLTISKIVTGNMSDATKSFPFHITLADQSGNPMKDQDIQVVLPGATKATICTTDSKGRITVNLKHGQQVTLQNLPKGTQYTIAETDAADYTATFSVTGGSYNSPVGHSLSGTLDDGNDVTVQVTNDFDFIAVTTGVRTDLQPYLLLLVFSLGTIVLLIIGKRKTAHR